MCVLNFSARTKHYGTKHCRIPVKASWPNSSSCFVALSSKRHKILSCLPSGCALRHELHLRSSVIKVLQNEPVLIPIDQGHPLDYRQAQEFFQAALWNSLMVPPQPLGAIPDMMSFCAGVSLGAGAGVPQGSRKVPPKQRPPQPTSPAPSLSPELATAPALSPEHAKFDALLVVHQLRYGVDGGVPATNEEKVSFCQSRLLLQQSLRFFFIFCHSMYDSNSSSI